MTKTIARLLIGTPCGICILCFIAGCNKPSSQNPTATSEQADVATTDVANPNPSDESSQEEPDAVDKLLAGDGLDGTFSRATPDKQDLYVPSRSRVIPDWLESRGAAQLATRDQFDVYHDFQFRDRQPASGIDWESTIVEDAGKSYVAAHYDHGNGIAIADIDGDGLYDIYLTSQIGPNALYRNLGQGEFQNITSSAGVELADRISVTASFADFDNDGDADLFVTTVRGGNALFRNDGNGKFSDVTKHAGLDYVGHSSASVFFDYNRDGLLDLFVTNVGKYTVEEKGKGGYYRSRKQAFAGHLKPELTETSILYRNIDGTRFEDVTQEMQLIDISWSGDATPVDANNDGWMDLYTLDMQGDDEYFENMGGKSFKKRTSEVFPTTPWGAMGVKVFDFNNDGRMDIYVTDMHSDMSERVDIDKEKLKANIKWDKSMLGTKAPNVFGNALFQKQPDGTYQEVSDRMGAENYWPWGLSVGDLNADGYEDVFIASSMNLPWRYGINSVLLNNRGKMFLDSEFILGVEPRRDGICAKPWFTLDCDGPEREHSYVKQAGIRSGEVTVWGALGSRASVIFDFDNDGDLDIVTNDFNSAPMVLESNLAAQRQLHFLKVKLVGKKSNRDGLGATVELVADGQSFKKVHDGQSGYLSQSSQLLYFGLGDIDTVDEVRVNWPSGTKQVVKPAKVNDVLVITEQE